MTAEHSAGAVSQTELEWHTIDWQAASENVRRLQARIVKATQAGRWGKVKALQHLLTHSFSAKVLAVRRVTENQGKRTPGVDGEVWDTPTKKAQAVHRLHARGYRPCPLRRVYIPKRNSDKKRPLGIPTMRDRAMQTLYLQALEPVAETLADPCSYGFRHERSSADVIVHCHLLLAGAHRPGWVLEGDIRACFDTISHQWLQTHIPIDKTLLRKWLKAGYMQDQVIHPTEEGTPQGGPLSPILANLTLDGLSRTLAAAFPRRKDGSSPMVNLVRYADDFIITGESQKLLENEVKPIVERFLKARGLSLSPEKTVITSIDAGFDFLGKTIRRYANGKVLSTPAKKNANSFLTKIRAVIKANPTLQTGMLIALLNPLIRGWCLYHQHDAAAMTFRKVNYAIYRALWRWAKRRHPTKSSHWIRHTYFKVHDQRHWVFSGELNGLPISLTNATDFHITRHVKIKGDANPFDPAWEPYFEHRLGVKMAQSLTGRRQLLALWKQQNGLCPVCQQKITTLTGWHNHHLIWRVHGGSETAENRVLLHPNCHALVHSQGLFIEKPRPSRGVPKARAT